MKIPNLNQIIKAGLFLSVCVGDMGRSFTARTFAKPPKRSAQLLTSDGKLLMFSKDHFLSLHISGNIRIAVNQYNFDFIYGHILDFIYGH